MQSTWKEAGIPGIDARRNWEWKWSSTRWRAFVVRSYGAKTRTATRKSPLIAWGEVTKAKKDGGLGLSDFKSQGEFMRLKQSAKLMEDSEEEWILAADLLIKRVNNKGRWSRERQDWTRQETLLLFEPIPGAPTVSGLIECWSKARQRLQLDRLEEVGEMTTITQITILGRRQGWFTKDEEISCRKILKKDKIKTVQEWKAWTTQPRGGQDSEPDRAVVKKIGRELRTTSDGNWKLQNMAWKWDNGITSTGGWTLPNNKWKRIVSKRRYEANVLNKKWSRNDTSRKWNKRLTNLWKSHLQVKDKTWIWKAGTSRVERVAKWRGESDSCKRCNQSSESVTHIFLDCRLCQKRWGEWDRLTKGTELELNRGTDLIELLDNAGARKNQLKLQLTAKILWCIWLERNSRTYNEKEIEIPLKVAITMAETTIRAFSTAWAENSKKRTMLDEQLATLYRTFETVIRVDNVEEADTPMGSQAAAGGNEEPERVAAEGSQGAGQNSCRPTDNTATIALGALSTQSRE
ncbi:hypothetical protein R1sor_012051 [Riccia sorocarpa]|uniref:Reverse transcriptase zinc-binding domain-containing protein n=1 Tax=Riccia sorocarpa TaxID=122646 RepID=A0ABD3I6B3_9MARC